MAKLIVNKTQLFRKKLEELPRERLLELIRLQDPELIEEIERIEYVFANKMSHILKDDGSPITERPLTNEELALLIDEPFEPDDNLTAAGISIADQRKIHIAKDPVTWCRAFLRDKKGNPIRPRVYQILMLRYPSIRKVFRAGRRLGKTFTLSVLLIHYSFTNIDGRYLVIAPMKAHVGLIYEEIMRLLEYSPAVQESVLRAPKSPQYEIFWKNGSVIRFFTSGIRSGGKTDVARGQEAHVIVLDELDMMAEDDLVALTAMLQQTVKGQEDKVMIGASTPTGRREIFWNWCHNPRYKEFWFPSYCNPNFKDEDEEEQRESLSEMAYRHEIEADWGEDAQGVYPKRYLDIAFTSEEKDYQYTTANIAHIPESFYVFGVDWNKYAAGVTICVLEVCGEHYPVYEWRNKCRVIHREETARDEYTLLDSIERIKVLNRIFHPQHIYVDQGYGEVQIELLHKYGKENPSTRLHKSVKGIGFAESIEVRDPFTKEKIKKEVKPFMVDNLRQMLEKHTIVFPWHDDTLYHDLMSYIVARSTPTGRPVFEMSGGRGDHAHDALILACLAVTQNYGELMKVDYALKSVALSNEVFLPTFDLSSDPSVRAEEEEIIKDKWGSRASAPIKIKRGMTHNTRGRHSPIKRKTF